MPDAYEGVPIQRLAPGESGAKCYFDEHMDRAERQVVMWKMHKGGMSIADIARQWNLTASTVRRILHPTKTGIYKAPAYLLKLSLDDMVE